jgi:steroid 5-alpha reductase family enzyme
MNALFESGSSLAAAMYGLAALLAIAILTWLVSLAKRDVSIVDSVWSMMILLAGGVYAVVQLAPSERAWWVLALAAIWATRLAGYITWRNWGESEDHRYQAIRARNQPNFEWKSLYLVFVLQAVLAWIVSFPLLAVIGSERPWNWLDTMGAALVIFGIVFEAMGDAQLAAFKARPENHGKVMNRGLWRYTRHPNYFGEFCVWWGFLLMALATGGWWAIVSPLLMSVLLMKVSGVALLEKDISDRRPAYRDYIARTNAFFPWPPR